ncbi:MAG: hypothetical protein AAFX99_16915 [Myxococcota bacterium]
MNIRFHLQALGTLAFITVTLTLTGCDELLGSQSCTDAGCPYSAEQTVALETSQAELEGTSLRLCVEDDCHMAEFRMGLYPQYDFYATGVGDHRGDVYSDSMLVLTWNTNRHENGDRYTYAIYPTGSPEQVLAEGAWTANYQSYEINGPGCGQCYAATLEPESP